MATTLTLPSKMNVIFLDVDGVLNTTRCQLWDFDENDESLIQCPIELAPLEKRCIHQLKRIVEETSCIKDNIPTKIVISSTWRNFPDMMKFLRGSLDECGIDSQTVIIGHTTSQCAKLGRGYEVKEYLEQYKDRINNYVILDDQHHDSFKKHLPPTKLDCFIETKMAEGLATSEEGLTEDLATNTIKILLDEKGGS